MLPLVVSLNLTVTIRGKSNIKVELISLKNNESVSLIQNLQYESQSAINIHLFFDLPRNDLQSI